MSEWGTKQVHEWMDAETNRRMNECSNCGMTEWINERTNEWMNEIIPIGIRTANNSAVRKSAKTKCDNLKTGE